MEKPGSAKCWHVMYVHARHEKKIHSEMLKMGIESFLPMKKELHTWSDRKKWIEVPLFSCYVFVRIDPSGKDITSDEKNRVYLLNGFVKFVSSNGKPSIVPQWQIDGIRKIVDSYPDTVEVLDSDYVGTDGAIIGGPLSGMTGKIIEVKNRKCFLIKIDGIEKVLSVTIPVSSFKPFPSQRSRRSEGSLSEIPAENLDKSGQMGEVSKANRQRLPRNLNRKTPNTGQPGSSTIRK
ncbi:MAG TPA: UpxY family transcription antiterminator [Candidatus Acidoferrales bacterium]|nr:UpxY family transcription antiterminator [Candidatus Acidoferrales bacterium]